MGVLCNSQGGRGRACGGSIRGGEGRGGVGGGGAYIFTIRKQHSVNKVHTLRYSVSKISEYKSRCCGFLLFCYILCRKSWYLVQCHCIPDS